MGDKLDKISWMTLDEAVSHFIFGGITIFVYSYAIYLCCAIYDYQDEKPEAEKCPLDPLIKDWMNSQFFFVYYVGFVQFISLFTPSVKLGYFVYMVSYLGIFLFHFHVATIFVYMYIQYVYTFQPDDIGNIDTLSLRRKGLFWKFIITSITLLLSIVFPLEDQPIPFQLLTKGREYDR